MIRQTLRYGDTSISYQVRYVPDKLRALIIHLKPDGSVLVDAPPDAPLQVIKQGVLLRARWLNRHVERCARQQLHVLPREYVSGEGHFYLGKRYVLKVRCDQRQPRSVKLQAGQFVVNTHAGDVAEVRRLLMDWYRVRAQEIFQRRLEQLCGRLPWVRRQPKWRLLAMKKQWGSCSPQGVLILNPHLVKASLTCIDYVLLHELCHLKVHSHHSSFYRLLDNNMQNWREIKCRLDAMAEILLAV